MKNTKELADSIGLENDNTLRSDASKKEVKYKAFLNDEPIFFQSILRKLLE
jgi:hypothetical protein